MNKIISELFDQYKVNFENLKKLGFSFDGKLYCYKTLIMDNQMKLTITIDTKGHLTTEVFDLDADEVYTLFLVEEASGAFVGEVRKEYEKALCNIRDNCYEKTIFTSNFSAMIIQYVEKKYGDKLEFLWEKTPTNAVLRRSDNKKWYCALLKVKAKVLGLEGENFVEVIDFRENPDFIANIITDQNKSSDYFPAYHMNKKYWLTIKLTDCTLPIEQVFAHIDNSYNLANKK